MIDEFVALLMASAAATPAQPSAASLTTYSGSLVQVNWTNAGAYSTRIYRKLGAGSWSLINTAAVGVTSYQTGDDRSGDYTYGVAHYNAGTGMESAIRQATPLAPPSPGGVSTELY